MPFISSVDLQVPFSLPSFGEVAVVTGVTAGAKTTLSTASDTSALVARLHSAFLANAAAHSCAIPWEGSGEEGEAAVTFAFATGPQPVRVIFSFAPLLAHLDQVDATLAAITEELGAKPGGSTEEAVAWRAAAAALVAGEAAGSQSARGAAMAFCECIAAQCAANYASYDAKAAAHFAENGSSLQLFVKTLTGKTITISAEPSDMLHHLKEKIKDKEGIPIEDQRFVLHGGPMPPADLSGCTMRQLLVKNETTFHLIVRLHGCG